MINFPIFQNKIVYILAISYSTKRLAVQDKDRVRKDRDILETHTGEEMAANGDRTRREMVNVWKGYRSSRG